MRKVSIARQACATCTHADQYRRVIDDGMIEEVLALAKGLKGVRICQLNSTAFGGGVAELLTRHLPLLQGLGFWRTGGSSMGLRSFCRGEFRGQDTVPGRTGRPGGRAGWVATRERPLERPRRPQQGGWPKGRARRVLVEH